MFVRPRGNKRVKPDEVVLKVIIKVLKWFRRNYVWRDNFLLECFAALVILYVVGSIIWIVFLYQPEVK